MDSQSNPEDARLQPVGAELAPPPDTELGTDVVPDSMVAEFSSLTTPYCWVIIEDAVAGYDGAEPSTVGKSGPGAAIAEGVAEALTACRLFRLGIGEDVRGALAAGWFFGMADGKGRELAIGRLYDPSGKNELAPLDDFGRPD